MKRLVLALLLLSLVVATTPFSAAQTTQASSDETTKRNDDWIWILIGGGLLYFLLRPHPHHPAATASPITISMPTPTPVSVEQSPPPTVEQTPTPAPTPTPQCGYFVSDGWFEPMQTVYQDDPDFADKPAKQLTRVKNDDYPLYTAELRQVQNRPGGVTGVDHYQYQGAKVEIPADLKRNYVVVKVKSNCPDNVSVRLRVRGDGITPDPIQYTPAYDQLPLEGKGSDLPRDKWPEYTLKYYLGNYAWPFNDPMYITQAGPYAITAEVVDAAGKSFSPQLKVVVKGEAIPTFGFNVVFIPITFVKLSDEDTKAARADADRLADDVRLNLPDVYPLLKGQITTKVMDPVQLDPVAIGKAKGIKDRSDAVQAALVNQFSVDAFNQKAQRVITIYEKQFLASLLGVKAAGVTLSPKLIGVVQKVNYWTAGHELSHSINYLWSSPEMIKQCDKDYHNDAGVGPQWKFEGARKTEKPAHLFGEGPANGIRFTEKGVDSRHPFDKYPPMMSASTIPYMAQCTYKHLLDGLSVKLADPAATLVRGFLFAPRAGAGYRATFEPFYDGTSDGLLKAGARGKFAFAERDANGKLLVRYPFTPVFASEYGHSHQVIAFADPLPALDPHARLLELIAPNGVIARKTLTAAAPHVAIVQPQGTIAAGDVRFSWTSDPGLAFTAYLTENGRLNRVFFESPQHVITLHLLAHAKYLFDLIATNGTHSTRVMRRFSTR